MFEVSNKHIFYVFSVNLAKSIRYLKCMLWSPEIIILLPKMIKGAYSIRPECLQC